MGRTKGTPNRKTEHIFEMCEKKKFDPIEFLILVAQGEWKKIGYLAATRPKFGPGGLIVDEEWITMDHRIEASKKLADFMYPKRKAIELSGAQDESPLTISYVPKSERKLIE